MPDINPLTIGFLSLEFFIGLLASLFIGWAVRSAAALSIDKKKAWTVGFGAVALGLLVKFYLGIDSTTDSDARYAAFGQMVGASFGALVLLGLALPRPPAEPTSSKRGPKTVKSKK